MVAFLHSLELIVLVDSSASIIGRWPSACMSGLSDHAEDLITRVTLHLEVRSPSHPSFRSGLVAVDTCISYGSDLKCTILSFFDTPYS